MEATIKITGAPITSRKALQSSSVAYHNDIISDMLFIAAAWGGPWMSAILIVVIFLPENERVSVAG